MSSPADIERIKNAFNEADKGGAGKITREALCQIFRSLESDWSDEDLKDLFDLCDPNKDGFIRYASFVNFIMQDDGTDPDDGDDTDDDGNNDMMEKQVELGNVTLDLTQKLQKQDFVMLAVRLGEDKREAGDTFDELEARLKEEKEDVGDGIELHEFMMDLQIEMEDKEALIVLAQKMGEVWAQRDKKEADPQEAHANSALNVGIDKLLRKGVDFHRPVEDSWKLFEEDIVNLSDASKDMINQYKDKQAEFLELVKKHDYDPPMLHCNAGQTGNREKCVHSVDKIIKDCKAAGTKFTDPEWDMMKDPRGVLYVDKKAPGFDCTVGKPAAYKRLTEITKNPVVFKGGIKAGDIRQGQIGTCFLLGAVGAIAGNCGKALKKIFIKYDTEIGVYGIRLNLDGEWVHVIVDDVFPVNSYGQLLYAGCKDVDETWVPLMEKAFCKLHTCYEMCDGGRPSEAIASFFGGASGRFIVDKKQKEDPKLYFKVLKQARDRGWLLTTGFNPPKAGAAGGAQGKCGEAVLASGLVGGHVYSVLKMVEAGGVQLVQCRNPWGTGEWTGKWSDANKHGEWTPEMVKACDKSFEDDGKFWMAIEDFVADTNGVDFARVFGPQWKKISHYRRFSSKGDLKATAQWAYKAGAEDEISFDAKEEVEVESFNKGWWFGHTANHPTNGFFPGNYVKINDRPVARFDLFGEPYEGKTSMSVAILMMQPNSHLHRKFYKRKEDGLNYKDTSYPRVSLVVLDADGNKAMKKEGKKRILSGDFELKGKGVWRVYAYSVDGTGADFCLRAYVKDGNATFKEVDGCQITEIANIINT